jgi:hypothetical protein
VLGEQVGELRVNVVICCLGCHGVMCSQRFGRRLC